MGATPFSGRHAKENMTSATGAETSLEPYPRTSNLLLPLYARSSMSFLGANKFETISWGRNQRTVVAVHMHCKAQANSTNQLLDPLGIIDFDNLPHKNRRLEFFRHQRCHQIWVFPVSDCDILGRSYFHLSSPCLVSLVLRQLISSGNTAEYIKVILHWRLGGYQLRLYHVYQSWSCFSGCRTYLWALISSWRSGLAISISTSIHSIPSTMANESESMPATLLTESKRSNPDHFQFGNIAPATLPTPTQVMDWLHLQWRNSGLTASSCRSDKHNLQDGAPKIAKLPYKWLNYGLW